jgi:hypothetical protein
MNRLAWSVAILLGVLPRVASAQLLEMRQTIFGMD